MKYKKQLNNSAVLAVDSNNQEYVVMGRGIAFAVNKGEELPENVIERIFYQKSERNLLEHLLAEIPQDCFEIVCESIEYIQENLDEKLSNSVYIALMDHISFIRDRARQGMLPKNTMKWEISRYYPKEYRLGRKITELLEDEFEIKLNDDEAASIALHIINAKTGTESKNAGSQMVYLVDDIIQIICFQTDMELDISDLRCQRLVTHVKFFIQRVLQGKGYETDDSLYPMIKEKYPKAHGIAVIIKEFVEKKLSCKISNEEILYLTIHIQHIIA